MLFADCQQLILIFGNVLNEQAMLFLGLESYPLVLIAAGMDIVLQIIFTPVLTISSHLS